MGCVKLQDRGQWTEEYVRWRRRNFVAPDAKVSLTPCSTLLHAYVPDIIITLPSLLVKRHNRSCHLLPSVCRLQLTGVVKIIWLT